MKKIWISYGFAIISLLLITIMLFTSSCTLPTQDETELLEDLLNRLDAVEGDITFVTRDGETVHIKVTKESSAGSAEKDEIKKDSQEKDLVTDKDKNILPSIESKEDVFELLGVWEQARLLREKELTWSHTAEELGYGADSMYAQLGELAERELHDAVEEGLIDSEQMKKKFTEFMDIVRKWVDKIFADDAVDTGSSLEDYLPALSSIEDVFKTLGVWEKAHTLREEGAAWSDIAAELGYGADSMYAQLEAYIETTLKKAQEEGLINQEQLEYKIKRYGEIAMLQVKEIFAEPGEDSTPDISQILPVIENIDDVFRMLGVWEDAHKLREQGLTWSHIAEELGYSEDSMYQKLRETAEKELHDAKTDGLISYEQYLEMLDDYTVIIKDWVHEIFSDADVTAVTD